ncbi:MAG: Fic family protein [Minisyncoccia bacterium]
MYFKLKKPDLSKIEKEQIPKALLNEKAEDVFDFIKRANEPGYFYWDKIKYKEPAPIGASKEELWAMIKFFRKMQSIKTPLKDENGKYFSWIKLPYLEEFFHDLDMNTGGELFVGKAEIDKRNKQKLITRGIMEEAIASSQLEGAATSRQIAKKMLREGRKPRNESEQMIVNNYLSMKALEDNYKSRKMSIELLLEIHGLITKDILDEKGEEPRIRKEGEDIYVVDKSSGDIYHKAPDIKFTKEEMDKLVKFANDELETGYFMHPVIKAIILHFWMGYLHPFTDGNGRLARLLFYWYLLKEGYWAFAYLPISKIIKLSPIQYEMAYVYSEQDDNDLTYFIDYNIKKVELAMKDFAEYLERQAKGNVKMKKKSETKYKLNDRQIYLLQYLYGAPDERTALKMHMNVYQVAKMTASKDLKELAKKGFLKPLKKGRNIYYYGTDKVKELFD